MRIEYAAIIAMFTAALGFCMHRALDLSRAKDSKSLDLVRLKDSEAASQITNASPKKDLAALQSRNAELESQVLDLQAKLSPYHGLRSPSQRTYTP